MPSALSEAKRYGYYCTVPYRKTSRVLPLLSAVTAVLVPHLRVGPMGSAYFEAAPNQVQ